LLLRPAPALAVDESVVCIVAVMTELASGGEILVAAILWRVIRVCDRQHDDRAGVGMAVAVSSSAAFAVQSKHLASAVGAAESNSIGDHAPIFRVSCPLFFAYRHERGTIPSSMSQTSTSTHDPLPSATENNRLLCRNPQNSHFACPIRTWLTSTSSLSFISHLVLIASRMDAQQKYTVGISSNFFMVATEILGVVCIWISFVEVNKRQRARERSVHCQQARNVGPSLAAVRTGLRRRKTAAEIQQPNFVLGVCGGDRGAGNVATDSPLR